MAAIPGDWYIGHSDSESYPVKDQMRCVFSGQPNGERYMVAKVWAGDDGDYEGTARLVAAAPELLEAARLANQELIDLGQGSSASPALRALWWAIAKAEGRE